jgi:hypothetical protein
VGSPAETRTCGHSDELDENFACSDLVDELAGGFIAWAEPGLFLVGDPPDRVYADLAVVELLPDLRARDLRGGHILHQIVDRDRSGAVQPGGDALKRS